MRSLQRLIGGPLLADLALRAGMSASIATPSARIAALMALLRPQRTDSPMVRLGPPADGGYLVPDSLSGIKACFSPGVCDESGFELACAQRGMDVFLADGSVDSPPISHPRFSFVKMHVGMIDSARTTTLDRWIDSAGIGHSEDLLLQMDIEGGEHAALAALSPARLGQFRHIVVEFHQLQMLWHEVCFEYMEATFLKLLSGHVCVHIHPNNSGRVWRHEGLQIPMTMEFTFTRRRDARVTGPCTDFPHRLDRANLPNRADTALPPCWRGANDVHAVQAADLHSQAVERLSAGKIASAHTE
jgi:hypothetical protein